MEHFKTIEDYCRGINIIPPRYKNFDIRSFEENMKTVVNQMPPFRHEFYAIAIKADGDGKAITGEFTDFPEGATLFFNTPFQIVSWDIISNWKGYYLMFSQDFIAQSNILSDILTAFPFLKIDQSIPFEVPTDQLATILSVFSEVRSEYHSEKHDKFQLIEAQLYLLLNLVRRLFEEQVDIEKAASSLKAADLKLLTRYQTLIQTSFYPEHNLTEGSKLHSTQYYAEKLGVHPNHLNAVVKSVSGNTALSHIHKHIVSLAKSYLAQTSMSVKEIAYALQFESPNNFGTFFKRNTGSTPLSYREEANL